MLNRRDDSMRALRWFIAVLVATIGFPALASAVDLQSWNVSLSDDSAVITASENTQNKFVQATIESLQDAGTKKFTLRALKSGEKMEMPKIGFVIRIDEGTAEIRATKELPYKILVSLIDDMKKAGLKKVKIARIED